MYLTREDITTVLKEMKSFENDLNDVSKGSWQYLINGESEFKDFIFSDFDGFACDYILLDDNDRIRFVPNDNEKSDFGQILTYPSFVFYAWLLTVFSRKSRL